MITLLLRKIMKMRVQKSYRKCSNGRRCQQSIQLLVSPSLPRRLRESGTLLNLDPDPLSPRKTRTPSNPLLLLPNKLKRNQRHHPKTSQSRHLNLKGPAATTLVNHYASHGPE